MHYTGECVPVHRGRGSSAQGGGGRSGSSGSRSRDRSRDGALATLAVLTHGMCARFAPHTAPNEPLQRHWYYGVYWYAPDPSPALLASRAVLTHSVCSLRCAHSAYRARPLKPGGVDLIQEFPDFSLLVMFKVFF